MRSSSQAGFGAAERGGVEVVAFGDAADGAGQMQAAIVGADLPGAFGGEGDGVEPGHQVTADGGGAAHVGGEGTGDGGLFEDAGRDGGGEAAEVGGGLAEPDHLGHDLVALEHLAVGVGEAGLGEGLVEQEVF